MLHSPMAKTHRLYVMGYDPPDAPMEEGDYNARIKRLVKSTDACITWPTRLRVGQEITLHPTGYRYRILATEAHGKIVEALVLPRVDLSHCGCNN